MASIKDSNVCELFSKSMEETHNKLVVTTSGEITEACLELYHSSKQILKSAFDTCSKKFKDDEKMFETVQAYRRELEHMAVSVKQKQDSISETLSDIKQKEERKNDLSQKIQRLGEEQARKKKLMESQKKVNKEKLKNLNRAKEVFQEHLGLEIRKIRGEKLQFIFRNINPAEDYASTFIMGIQADGIYQILSSDPPIECLPALEKRLQETNNFSAFLANVRKEFVCQARCL
ncbi:kinetochore protein Spc25 [Lampris incognitus]|uniref:kinetochore protein Spc25 n=1 Tax=Lampris incognitus TaxID=2546036 RepID=UPI0024B608EB|nr:kinetochore protein Spc25 [Lampris incognitus]